MKSAALDLLEAIRAEQVPDEVPKGWYTVKQISEQTGFGLKYVQRRVVELKAEVKIFRIKTGMTKRPVPHYRLQK